ncbi:MAG: hypothetical protein ABII19_02150 [Patescibacteria group bacterium]
MPNGDKNSGNDDIELLPLELRRPEEKKKKEERPEVKLFVPETEEKSPKSKFMGKFFSSRQGRGPASIPPGPATAPPKPTVESELSVFKMQKEVSGPAPAAPSFSPRPIEQAPSRSAPLPPKPQPVQRPAPLPEQKVEQKQHPQNGAPKKTFSKPQGEKRSLGQKLGITLIPEEESVEKEKKKTSKKIILLIVAAILLALIGGGLYWTIKWYGGQAENDLQKVETDLGGMEKKNQGLASEKNQAQLFQKQLKAAGRLLENHIYWTNFFSFLEKNTVADVYFVNLVGGNDGQVVMSGVAKSYAAMSRQIVAFKSNDLVSKISVLSASASVDPEGNVAEINFDARLQLNPEIFLK